MPQVIAIPPTLNKATSKPLNDLYKRKVAAYARVSTDSEEQLTSYEAQVDYYTRYIKSRSDWEFIKVYTDEGITATNTKKRDGYKEMIRDALAGKIDLIVTKSVSRFARNTVDCLSTVRDLKDKNIEIYFEKENIWTLSTSGELLISIFSSLAQDESRNISENVAWGHRKRFADGKFSLAYSSFLGYEKGQDGKLKIVEAEAKIVRLIYQQFMLGKTPTGICRFLESKGIKSPTGKDKWQSSTVKSILTNEKYKGDALLQKTYTADFLQKKIKKNNGELMKYYITGCHDSIIEPKEWELVQIEMKRRKTLGSNYSGNDVFASRIICECCGSFFGKKVWHSTDKYRREIWRCNGKFTGDSKCQTTHFTTEEFKNMFLKAYSQYMINRDEIVENCEMFCRTITDTTNLEKELEHWNEEANLYAGLMTDLVKQNARQVMNQENYAEKYNALEEKYNKASQKCNSIEVEISKKQSREKELHIFIDNIKQGPTILTEWDDILWITLIETAMVHTDGSITYKFKNGALITIEKE